MPVAVIQDWPGGGSITANYDEINERMGVREDPPAGLILHTAGTNAAGDFRIFDVWESLDAFERFQRERLMPVVQEVVFAQDPPPPPPTTQTYELYGLLSP